jgi:predicted DNA-binding transcriptional regulator YafY
MFPRGAMAVLEPYFKAAHVRMKQTEESSLSHWPDKVRVVSRNLQMKYPEISEDIREHVYTAVLEERRFGATYRTLGGTIKNYDVNPLGMAFVEGLTYLIATLNAHEDPILLLLHRLVDVRPTDVPVTIPEGFNLDEYVDEELKFPLGDDIKLKAIFSDTSDIERLRETPISEDQKITEKAGGWLFQATVGNSYQLRWWLRGYGERVQVIGPTSLRQEYIEMVQSLSNLYLHAGSAHKSG